MAKKITALKQEGVGEIVDRILAEPNDEITLVIPKGSPLSKSARNFGLLKREAEAAGKSLAVESTDENIVALAREAGIGSAHGSSRTTASGSISDIVPARHSVNLKVRETKEELRIEEAADTEEEEEEPKIKPEPVARERFFKERTIPLAQDEDESGEGKPSRKKWIGAIVLILIVIGVILAGITSIFGHVTIAINFQTKPWQYQGSFTADKSVAKASATGNVIPGQVFSIPKNATQLYPATSEQNVSVKAQGAMTIYNAYSSAAQTLVATTRFVTPDGKIFRLVNKVDVPGAKITNGQIVPSSIGAQIVADQAGPDYNVGPVAKLTVPGFANTPKEQGFYGTISSSTTGGFIGKKMVATNADIASAKAKMTALLQADLQSGLTGSYPNNFKILNGATTITITKLTVNSNTDTNGNFSVFGEAKLQTIGFDETVVKNVLLASAQATEQSSTFSTLDLTYTNVVPDFTTGKLTFSVAAQGSLEPALSIDLFKQEIEGKSVDYARTTIASLPELADGSISAWPSWLWTIPTNPSKIQINVK